MSNEEIYRQALIELAKQDYPVAKMALSLAAENNESSPSKAKEHLSAAVNQLSQALIVNGEEWSDSVDDYITNAQSNILSAMRCV